MATYGDCRGGRQASIATCAGVLLCGCSPEVRERLASALAGNSTHRSDAAAAEGALPAFQKEYLALVEGHVQADHGVIRTPIGRVAYGVRGGLHAASPDGKACESRWRLVRRNPDDTSLVAVTIRTGESELSPQATKGVNVGFDIQHHDVSHFNSVRICCIDQCPASPHIARLAGRVHNRSIGAQAGHTRSGYTWLRRGTLSWVTRCTQRVASPRRHQKVPAVWLEMRASPCPGTAATTCTAGG